MPTHPGYFTDSLAGQPWYRCVDCHFDTFSLESMTYHARLSHARPSSPAVPNLVVGKRVALTFLTWSTKVASEFGYRALQQEALRLRGLGLVPKVFWFDNGSTDGTRERLKVMESGGKVTDGEDLYWSQTFPENVGQSIARNLIIDAAQSWGYDYLLMVDGDIEIVPFSAYAMANYLESYPWTIGSIGMYSRNCTANSQDPELAPECKGIEPYMTQPGPTIAWTEYGMFRACVFDHCRFDASEAFNGPGWGFEDEDLGLQMLARGFSNQNTRYFRHLHRKRHSSLGLLGQSLGAKVFAERKAYLLRKWGASGNPLIASVLAQLENQSIPVVDCQVSPQTPTIPALGTVRALNIHPSHRMSTTMPICSVCDQEWGLALEVQCPGIKG